LYLEYELLPPYYVLTSDATRLQHSLTYRKPSNKARRNLLWMALLLFRGQTNRRADKCIRLANRFL